MNTFKYRPDIDGLRAIAVLSVVIFHINPKWLPSGFLGVDIFFVLSGFLITSIIYREMNEGKFSFKEFYIRRIKRILPLFFVVLMTGLLVSWYIFLPNDRNGVSDSALSSLIFLANRYFARQGGYFDTASDEKPFLHLWSLSIEEQFYFVFPICLLMFLRFSFLRRNILKILGSGIVLALLFGFIDLKQMGIIRWDIYYMSHIRAGEMLIGSFLAIYREEKRREEKRREEKRREEKRREEKRAADYLGIFLLFTLIVCFFLDDVFVSPLFPGILALIPCGATALLIYTNEEKNWVSSFLSTKPIVWLGKISYSLYLWHWVVLAIMRYVYQESELPWKWNLVAVILMLSLSVFTYYLIENPCRKLQWSFGRSVLCFYIIPSGMVLMINYKMQNNDVLGELENSKDVCHNEINDNCEKGDLTKVPKLLFVGNSLMWNLNPWIDKVGKAEGWSATVISSSAFYFAIDGEYKGENMRFMEFAKQRDQFFMKHYKNYPIVVLLHSYHKRKEYKAEIIETIKKLNKEGKKVYILTIAKRAKVSPLREYYFKNMGLSFRTIEVDKTLNELDFIPDSLGVRKIDLTPYVPDSFYIDDKPVLSDKLHWNVYGSEKMAEIFISKGKRFIKEEDLE